MKNYWIEKHHILIHILQEKDDNFVTLFAFLKWKIVTKFFNFQSNFKLKQSQRFRIWIQVLNRSDSASRLLEGATLWIDFFLKKSSLEKVYGVKNFVLFLFPCKNGTFCFLFAFSKWTTLTALFQKYSVWHFLKNLLFSVSDSERTIFQIFWFRNKKLPQRVGFCIKLLQRVRLSILFFSPIEADLRLQSRFVLFYPGETDYRCILFAFSKRTKVTKNLFCK